ncbi:MAG: tannase/feruloyl esterase family alpha/beta hydrolase [Gammaproteobacteria bacterium]|nr:tannase/feruloyl esterase family alpha/beta hydrolase [Gammaproteobacteria bacterium]
MHSEQYLPRGLIPVPHTVAGQTFVTALAMVLFAPVSPAAPTPNGSSFSDAQQSRIDYTRPEVTQPLMDCAEFIRLSGADNSILSATLFPADSDRPEMCVVMGVIAPEVRYIVYLPSRWNGRLYMHGNGGYAGEALNDEVGHLARLKAARLGFATAFTNTGHDEASEPGGTWAHNNLQKEIDFGYRAVHLTAAHAKQLATAYYGRAPGYSYFDGCSTGGLQGFSEAQRFPADFDGILAGAPVFSLREMIWQYWKNQKAITETPLTRERLELLGDTVLDLFDMADGVRDGVIGNPDTVDFNPGRDLPRTGGASPGFTDAEITTLATIYGPVYVGDKEIYPRTVVGGEFPGLAYEGGTYLPAAPESAWEGRVVPDSRGRLEQQSILESWFRYFAFETDDSELDWKELDPKRDLSRMTQSGRIFNATDPDLSAFRERGGKMIIYHGWADFGVNPLSTVDYYRRVAQLSDDGAAAFLRLYLVPGMHHCAGGVNIDRFDLITPLIDWVETGVAPRDLVGYRVEHGRVTRSRPLCPYPRVARYRGTGSIDAHENFACVEP